MLTDADQDEAAFAAELEQAFGPLAQRFAHCPKPDLLRAASAGVLPPSIAASVRGHIEACPLCRALSHDLEELPEIGLTEDEQRRVHQRVFRGRLVPMGDRRRSQARRAWIGTAAAVAIAASLLLAVLPQADVSLPSVQQPARLLLPPFPRVSVLQVDKPALKLPLAVVVSLRGAGSTPSDLEQGLALYRNDDFEGAAEHLARVVPNAAVPQLALYLGVAYLQIGDAERAERTLSVARAQRVPGLSDDVEWYLAVAHVRLGQTARAREELDRLCGGRGELATRACAALIEVSRHNR